MAECNVPTRSNVDSFSRWMRAVKPLIQPETRFLQHADEFVTAKRATEEGLIEETVEKFARRYRIGNGVCVYTSRGPF